MLKIFKLDAASDLIATFPIGLHEIGRGPNLQCNDKRVSRSHAALSVTKSEATITSLHINPCFLKPAEGKSVTILQKDTTASLQTGDTFALLPDTFWFKVEFDPIHEEPHVRKRSLSPINEEMDDKRVKYEENHDENTPNNIKNEDIENNAAVQSVMEEPEESVSPLDNITEVLQESAIVEENADITEPNEEHRIDDGEEKSENEEVPKKEEDLKEEDGSGDTPGPSTTTKRERCWYGDNCYRKNPTHRTELSHPGDADYDSDPSDTRPVCSYGANCYRKNKEHLRDFKHPPRQDRGNKKRTRKKVATTVYDEDLSEEESEDPYMTDGEDSDYEESE